MGKGAYRVRLAQPHATCTCRYHQLRRVKCKHIRAVAISVKRDEIDVNKLVLSYDRESDTLMVHLHGRGQPGVSRLVTDEFMIRLDADRQRVLGFQIEHFLSRVVPEHPRLLDALDIAELRGISLEEVAQLRRDVATNQKRQTIADVIAEFPPFDPAHD